MSASQTNSSRNQTTLSEMLAPNPVDETLYYHLETKINQEIFTDLHTHLMGLGDADWWVDNVIEGYIPRKESSVKGKQNAKVFYAIEDLCRASGKVFNGEDREYADQKGRAVLEARIFDNYGFTWEKNKNNIYGLSNENLAKRLQKEKLEVGLSGPLRGLVRNWFELLDPSGNRPDRAHITSMCK